ncbi:MAG: SRPBCC family protein [Methanobacterium sp.]|uniref:SRPBCC family protein n=1 Tax=Methanobacterium sp. TaxID=2164 RepID=UPI003C72534E
MSKVDFVAESGKQTTVITQIFDAPRDLVWKIYTDPKLLSKWWGPKMLETNIEQMEVKTGGSWRVVQKDTEGNEFAFHGVYHDVKPYNLTRTMEWEGMPGHVLLETVKMEEINGKTKVTDINVFQSVEDRDGMVETGMKRGVDESYERFVMLLKEFKAKS